MHPGDVEARKKNNTLKDWLAQEDLNVAITGICDVFDLHAENGLATAAMNSCRRGSTFRSSCKTVQYLSGNA